MNKLTLSLAAAVLALGSSVALAAPSAFDILNNGDVVSFETIQAGGELNAQAGNGRYEQSDLSSVRALISQNPKLLSQLESYGKSLDDVVGLGASGDNSVTVYVRG